MPTNNFSSEKYWINRYRTGGGSGPGSMFRLAAFKARTINELVKFYKINTVIEFGCGEGSQLSLAEYLSYIGFDVSPHALDNCKKLFAKDPFKVFKPLNEYIGETADLVLSLDVIFHLVEDAVFEAHMELLFLASTKYVLIYSSNKDVQDENQALHVFHRKFTDWIEKNKPEWKLKAKFENPYPYRGDWKTESFSDFYLYAKE